MKLQETLYRREGHKEYREGYANIDWDNCYIYGGESDVLKQLEFEKTEPCISHHYESIKDISEDPIDINKMGDSLVATDKHCSNCEHYDNCNTFGNATDRADRADKCGTYTKRGE